MKGRTAENWLKLVRLYTFYSPIRKGKFRMFDGALSLCAERPEKVIATTYDGRKLHINLQEGIYDIIYFLGEYERTVSEFIKACIKPGDTCFDIGTNFGWYTTLLRKACGTEGKVYGFEALPSMVERVNSNLELMGDTGNVIINNVALGDKPGAVEMHIFDDLSVGHSSLSAQGHDSFTTVKTEMITLDSYLSEHGIDKVDFVKVDIEGAELMFLQGATSLFKLERLPVFMIEMALATSKSFGYLPNDLVQFVKSQADYQFYAIDELHATLTKIDGFSSDHIGANVLCIPEARMPEMGHLFR